MKARNEHGYGIIRARGRSMRAHRVALFGEEDPGPDVKVRHSCDNPPCCNPRHLLPGTQAQNIEDMHERGRAVKPQLRVPLEDREDIKTAWSAGETTGSLSRKYGVCSATIVKIVAGIPGGRSVRCVRDHDLTLPGATRPYTDPQGVTRNRCVLCRRHWSSHYNKINSSKKKERP